jgi:Zn-dependent peptidase ImmA (M78 family)/transcriptional regulator with XRE-family HTH domain
MIGADIHTAALLFQKQRLTIARELSGMTKTELSKRVQKTPAAIGQFEGGVIKPDAQTLAKLALALGVPVGFFAEPVVTNIVPFEACHFRSQRAASQKERKRVLAAGALVTELVSFLEEHVSFPEQRVSEVAAAPANDGDIENIALDVRKRWGLGLGPIPNVIQLLETKGVVVTFVDNDSETIDAFSFWHEKRPCMFLVIEKGSTSRTRFDALHELGHLVMHVEVSHADQTHERQANQFASAFLMPRDTFVRECPRRFDFQHFLELKRRWRTSVAALLHRAYSLELISEASYRRGFMFLNQQHYRKNEPEEPAAETPQIIRRSVRLLQDSFTKDDPDDVSAAVKLDTLTRLVGDFVIAIDVPTPKASSLPEKDGAWAFTAVPALESAGRAAVMAALLAFRRAAAISDVRMLAVLALNDDVVARSLSDEQRTAWGRLTAGARLPDVVIDEAVSRAAETLFKSGLLIEEDDTWAPGPAVRPELVHPSFVLDRAQFAKEHALPRALERRAELVTLFPRALKEGRLALHG